MNKNTYKMTVAGCERELPICPVNDKLSIAAFIMFGDVEITERAASELIKKCPEHDILVTAEAKGIPICYEMARQENKPYFVARKTVKVYMTNPICAEVKSITTKDSQKIYLSENDVDAIKGKKVLIVDDVISTGESLTALERVVEAAGGNIVARAAVLAEGDATKRDDIIFLDELPLFFKD